MERVIFKKDKIIVEKEYITIIYHIKGIKPCRDKNGIFGLSYKTEFLPFETGNGCITRWG